MIGQFDNQVMSSFYLWFDHTLLDKGTAYTNYGSNLYSVNSLYQGYHTYGSPFRQFVADKSITNANIISGVYVDGAFKFRGSGDLSAINYGQGQAYFSSSQSDTLSGNYAVKDFNIFLTNQTEEKLLFETQFTLKNKVGIEPTGLPPDSVTYPAIFLKNMGGANEPFEFGGTQQTNLDTRAIVVSDSQFHLDAACSIFRDRKDEYIHVFSESEMPFNNLGDFNNNALYDYNNLISSKSTNDACFIDNVSISKIGGASFAGVNNLNPNVYSALIDFELNKVR